MENLLTKKNGFVVEILKEDKQLNLKVGDRFNAIRYHLDPHEKVTLLSRVTDGWIPDCNEYLHNVKTVWPLMDNPERVPGYVSLGQNVCQDKVGSRWASWIGKYDEFEKSEYIGMGDTPQESANNLLKILSGKEIAVS